MSESESVAIGPFDYIPAAARSTNELITPWEAVAFPGATASRDPLDCVPEYFAAYQSIIFGYARRISGNSADAEEITQEAFLRLYCSLQQGTKIEHIPGWLFTVTRNLLADRSRFARKRRSFLTNVLSHVWHVLAETVPATMPDLDKVIAESNREERLRAALTQLTTLQRDCLLLRLEGLTYREIGDTLDMHVQRVADAVYRAVAKLNAQFGESRDR